jgi:hypothetical protein
LNGVDDAVFKRGALFVAAKIVWSTELEAGLRFSRELGSEEFDVAFGSARLGPLAQIADRRAPARCA